MQGLNIFILAESLGGVESLICSQNLAFTELSVI